MTKRGQRSSKKPKSPAEPPVPAYIGRPQPRVEDRTLLTGAARFLDDIPVDGALELAFARSAHGHATLDVVDLEQARRAPGVELAIAAADLTEVGLLDPYIERPGAVRIARPALADDRVRFVGEAFAAVVATDRYLAEDAAELIEARFTALPSVESIEGALRDGAPALHSEGNLLFHESRETGDVDAAMANAAVVVERTFHNPRYSATPIEPRGVLAVPDGDGLVVWSSTQIPHILEETLADLLPLKGPVRVRCPHIGGGFGQKAHVYPEEIVVAWAAHRLGRPVKWFEDRNENLLAASHSREQLVRARAAADADGRLLALDAEVYSDVGAYGIFPWGQLLEALGTPAILPGPYDLRNYRYVTHAVATNKSPQGAYRGVGLPVSAFVHERMMDLLAKELKLDRAAVRRVNFVPPESFPYHTASGLRYDSGNYEAAMDMALEDIGYEEFESGREDESHPGRVLGLGFSSYVEWSGTNSETYRERGMWGIRGYDAGRVAVEPDGTVAVWTSCPGIGQGVATTFAQVVADHLGVPFERIRAHAVDTKESPPGSGSFASRSAISAGGALISVAGEVRRRILETAADELEASSEDLTIVDGRVVVRGSPTAGLELSEVVARAEPGYLDVDEPYDPPETAYPYATHACIVAIDRETGDLQIVRYVVAEDCGTVINPMIVEGQVHGATAQGIGGTLFEAIRYGQDGQAQTGSLMDYLVPTASEIPDFTVHHLETPAPDGRAGFKGVGEGGTLAPPAALANAVADALGIEVNRLPITPELLADSC